MEFIEIIKVIWHDMITTPWGALLGITVICAFILKDQIREFASLLIKSKASNFGKSSYTKKDVLNHPLFRDLDYWIEKGIGLVRIEKSYAKELIMKDVLYVKFNVIKDLLYKNITSENIESITSSDLKKFFYDIFREMDANQRIGWRNAGIPEVFINKYLTIQQFGQEVVKNTTKVFLSSSIEADVYTKLYLVLSVMDAQLTNVYANAVSTALSLNGDLNGLIYKGVVIGKSSVYTIDVPVSKDIIDAKLNNLLQDTYASRAGIALFHEYPGDDIFSGKVSLVYEVCAPGIKSAKDFVQYLPAYTINDFREALEKGTLVSGGYLDFDYPLGKLMRENGTDIVAAYPIKNKNGGIAGFVILDWVSADKFNEDVKSVDLEKELSESAKSIQDMLLGYK